MPIYAYRCENCGFQKDVLQKMSDPLLVTCPSCGEPTFKKQVTAAGFQLKGSGWYVTDFRNPATKEGTKSTKGEGSAESKGNDGGGESKSDAPAPAPAPGGSSESKGDSGVAKAPPPAPPPSTTGSD